MAGLAALGTQFYWGVPLDETTRIAEVTSVSGPGITVDTIDVSSHDTDGWREFVAGLGDFGELTMECNFHPAYAANNQIELLGDMLDKTREMVTIVFPADPNWTPALPAYYFWSDEAIITGFEMAAPFDDKLSATITLKLMGVPGYGTEEEWEYEHGEKEVL